MILFRGLLRSYQTISDSAKKDTSPEGQQLLGGETETTTIQKQTFDLVVSEPMIQEKQLEKTTDGIPAEFIRNDLFQRVFQLAENVVLVETGARSITPYPLYTGTIGTSVTYLFRDGKKIPTLPIYFANYYYHTWDSVTFIIETLAQPMDYGPVAFVALPFTPKFAIPLDATTSNPAQYDWWSLVSSEHMVILDMCQQTVVEITVACPKLYEWFTSDPGSLAQAPTDPVYALPVLYCVGFGVSGNVAKTTSAFAYNVYAKFNGLRFAAPFTSSNVPEFQACSHWACATSPLFRATGYNHVGPCHGDMVSEPINNFDNNALRHDKCYHGSRSPSQFQECDRQLIRDNVRDFKVMGVSERFYAGAGNLALGAQMGYRALFSDLTIDGDIEANPGPPKSATTEEYKAAEERMNINPFPSDFSMRRNGNSMNVCALDEDCNVSYEQFGDSSRTHSWKDFIKRPGYYSTGVFSAGTSTFSYVHMGALWMGSTSAKIGLIPVCYASQFYRWWRGSFKIMLYFFGNAFVTARFRLVVSWGGSTGTEGSRFFSGFPTQDITVKGFVAHGVTIPYVYPTDWQPVENPTPRQGDGIAPIISLTCIQIINGVSTTVSPAIPVMFFWAAGDDFKFKEPVMTMSGGMIDRKEEFEACSAVRPFEDFQRAFDALPGIGGSTGELHHATQVPDLEDQLTRWSNYEVFAGDVGGFNYEFGTEMPTAFAGSSGGVFYNNAAQMISSLFYFAGGDQDFSTNLRSVPAVPSGPDSPGYTGPSAGDMFYISYGYGTSDGNYELEPDTSVPDNGAYYLMLQQWTNVRMTIPVKAQIPVFPTAWYNQANFRPGVAAGDPIADSRQIAIVSFIETYADASPTSTIDSVWFRAGPNFRLMRYLPLPSLVWWTNQQLIPPPALHAQKVVTAQLERTMKRARPYKLKHRTLNSYIASRLKQIYIDDGKGKDKDKDKTKKELGRILKNIQERDERQDSRLRPPGLTQGL